MYSHSPIRLSNKIQKFQIILTLFMITLSLMITNVEAERNRARCEKPDYIPNGSYRMRRDRVMRIACRAGFQLQGPKTIECIRGKWEGEKPVCAKKGCKNTLIAPENGRIEIEGDVKAILYCSENYNLAGNRHSYCNGTHWDRPIGNCREHKNVIQHSCDFETDDICGWTYEQREGLEWKRVMAANVFTSFKTGPRHDHTTMTANGGHYMLMESLTRSDDPVIFTSPIYDRSLSLKTACCFHFYYFMYGAGVGDLFVVVKPVSLSLDEILQKRKEFVKFKKNGNQNNIWNEAYFNIEELEEDFQILFVAKAGHGQLSDIAIDDVRLLTGDDCKAVVKKYDEDSSNEEYESTTSCNTDESIFEMQSCEGRCFDGQGIGIIKYSGHLKGLCSCEIECEDNETCCPDYRTVCLKELFSESTTSIYSGKETSKQNEELLYTTVPSYITAIPIGTTISSTPSTVKTTLTTPSTTTTTTMKTTTKMNTTPATLKTTPTTIKITKNTVKTTPTTVRTTSRATTIKSKTTQPTISTTIKQAISSSTTTHKTTTASTSTATPSATTTTTSKSVVDNKKSQVPTPIPAQKPMEYIINDKPIVEVPHRGSKFLLCVFIGVVPCILAVVFCRHFGSKVVAWYTIHFKPNVSGDEDSTSIIASYKGPTANSSTIVQRMKKCVYEKTKKGSLSNNGMATRLVDDVDDEDDNMASNGNIALKNNMYTEL